MGDADEAPRVLQKAGWGRGGHEGLTAASARGPCRSASSRSEPFERLPVELVGPVLVRAEPQGALPVSRVQPGIANKLDEWFEAGLQELLRIFFLGESYDAEAAHGMGMVNRVVPRAELADQTRELAERIALVPPATAQVVSL